MRKYTFLILIVIIVSIFNVVLLIQIRKNNADIYAKKISLRDAAYREQELNIRNENSKNLFLSNVKYGNNLINTRSEVIRCINSECDTICLENIFMPNKRYIVFRYSYLSCAMCIKSVLLNLEKHENLVNNVEIILLPYYQSLKEMKINQKIFFKNKFQAYQVMNNSIGLAVDTVNSPYLTFIPDGKTADDIFIINEFNLDMVEGYLDLINSKYD